jgi:LacI family transcriptional regulator
VATISEVARRAGVSAATVSRVLNGRTDVSRDLAGRVHTAVQELGYRPNGVARNLRRQATMVWGLIISDIGNPFFTSVVRGVEDAAHAAGYSLVLCNSDDELAKEQRYIDIALAEQLAGVIISPASEPATDLSALVERAIPVVAVDRRVGRLDVDTVLVDNLSGARLATEHLMDSGCARIACITGPTQTTTAAERLQGFRQAHDTAGRDVDPDLVVLENFKEDGGYHGAQRLLDSPTAPDGLFVANNLMTVGALEALMDAGVQIPADMLLVGFDDIPWARLTRPRLTTVNQPMYDMGREAGRLLTARIAGDTSLPRTVVLPPNLQIRDSSHRH